MSGAREASVQWKPEWTEALRGHLAFGLSASMAAAELNSTFSINITRCAVIGKARREDIPLAPAKIAGPKKVKPRRIKATPAPRPDILPKLPDTYVPVETNIPPGTTPLLERDENGCLWASGDGPFHFCNRPQAEGLPYCPGHAALAYRPTPERRR